MTRGLRLLGLLATAAIVALLALNILREPSRLEAALADQHAASIASGIDLYAGFCVDCHGAAGEGLGVYRALDQEFVRQQDYDALFSTIQYGRFRTDMTAFGLAQGGALTHAQINDLVLMVQAGPWPVVEARVAELGLTPDEDAVLAAQAGSVVALDVVASAADIPVALAVFEEHCSECHGESGEGTSDAPQLNSAYVQGMPQDQLLEILMLGVRNTDMEGFPDGLTDEDKAAILYLLRHWHEVSPAGTEPVDFGPSSASGQVLFETWCAICHGFNGEGGSIAPSLNDIPDLPADFIASRVRSGKNAMPPFTEADLSEADLRAVVTYARESIVGARLPVLSPEELAEAGALYAEHCAECHGAEGEGAGELGPRLVTAPAMRQSKIINFTRVGSALAEPVPPAQVSDEELVRIVAYIHSLRR